MMRTIAAFLVAMGLMYGTAAPARAASEEPGAVVKELFDVGLKTLQDGSLGKRERAEKLTALLDTYFYVDTMREWMLGRYRDTFTREQKTQYRALFSGYVVALFSPQLKNVASENGIMFTVLKEERARNGDSVVTTEFVRSGKEPVTILWRTRATKNGQKIMDVGYEGIWFAVAIREQVVSTIGGNGVSGFLETLEEKVTSLSRETEKQ